MQKLKVKQNLSQEAGSEKTEVEDQEMQEQEVEVQEVEEREVKGTRICFNNICSCFSFLYFLGFLDSYSRFMFLLLLFISLPPSCYLRHPSQFLLLFLLPSLLPLTTFQSVSFLFMFNLSITIAITINSFSIATINSISSDGSWCFLQLSPVN